MIYTLGSQMEETDMETVLMTGIPAIFLITEAQFPQVMEELSISVESDSPLSEICFCHAEAPVWYVCHPQAAGCAGEQIPDRLCDYGKIHRAGGQ